MSTSIAITAVAFLDIALLAGLAFVMAAPRKLAPHMAHGERERRNEISQLGP